MISEETLNPAVKIIFNLIVRIIGLAFLYQGLSAVPTAAANFWSLGTHFIVQSLFRTLFLVGWPLVIAYWMVRGAPWLMKLAFQDKGAAGNNVAGTQATISSCKQ
jgi:hypothetical protein